MGTDRPRRHTRIVAKPGALKKLRLEQGYRQDDFARRVGISRPQLSMIENGNSGVSEDTAIRIAERLRVDFGAVFDVQAPYKADERAEQEAGDPFDANHERPLFAEV